MKEKKYRTCLPAGRHRIRNQPAGWQVLNNEVNEVKNSSVQNSKFIICQPAGWFDINSSLTE
jgi:hypothetical protein